jgi:hypothetical protein
MVIKALLWVVLISQLAWLSFEVEEINKGHRVIIHNLMSSQVVACLVKLGLAPTHHN